MDIQIASDGAIYILAYGTNWFAKNTDSGIIRVEYSEGNRRPVAVASISSYVGAVPMRVFMSGKASSDFDKDDKLTYTWTIGRQKLNGADITHTFTKPGNYDILLTVTDSHGAQGTTSAQIRVGNEPPKVEIKTLSNRSFYWDNEKLNYEVAISDKEDKPVAKDRANVSFHYLPFGKDLASVLSAGNENARLVETIKLYSSLDCKACHTLKTRSIGPALGEIAKKYDGKQDAIKALANKIIKGGSGNWGSYPMPPHPDLSVSQATEIAEYILNLNKKEKSLPLTGDIVLNKHQGKGKEGAYVLQASYTDGGAMAAAPLKASQRIVLKSPEMEMEDFAEGNIGVVIATVNTGYVSYIANITHGKYVRFDEIDLTRIGSILVMVQEQGAGGTISVRVDRKDGLEIGSTQINPGHLTNQKTGWKEVQIPLKPTKSVHSLYFVFENPKSNGPLFHVDKMIFQK